MQGSYDVIIQVSGNEYEPVMAYAIDPQIDNSSSTEGTYFQGVRINWTTDGTGGITGEGWYTTDPESPFHGADPVEIVNHANTNQNLNMYFSNWSVTDKQKHSFVGKVWNCCEIVS